MSRKTKIGSLIVLLLILIISLFIILNSGNADAGIITSTPGIRDASGNVESGNLPFEDPEKLKAELQKKVDESMLNVKMNTNPVFESGSSEGALAIANPSVNRYRIQVEIFLDSTDESVYLSPILFPDQHVATGKLSTDLPAGNYEATAMFNAYELDSDTFVGKVAVGINLSILN